MAPLNLTDETFLLTCLVQDYLTACGLDKTSVALGKEVQKKAKRELVTPGDSVSVTLRPLAQRWPNPRHWERCPLLLPPDVRPVICQLSRSTG